MGVIMVDSKLAEEIIPVSFDFIRLINTIDSVESLAITVKDGVDTNVGAMLIGSPVINEATVSQLVKEGVAGVIYRIKAKVISGSEKYTLALDLPVRELN